MQHIISTGWVPDYPDFRDYRMDNLEIKTSQQPFQKENVAVMLKKVGIITTIPAKNDINKIELKDRIKRKRLPSKFNDIQNYCSPINNQGDLGSCTAHAATGLLEYYENRALGRYIKASRLFLYKASRNLLKWEGDQGAFLRSTMGAMALFGVCPEEYWPYEEKKFDTEPTAFCYSFAANYQALNYYRIDTDIARYNFDELLYRVKLNLNAHLPMMFGFSVFSSIDQSFSSQTKGRIPFPTLRESNPDGHAVMAVGYDDNIKIKNRLTGGYETKGALLIRNSWGEDWGEEGYGWLPYEYILKGMTSDWWSLIKNEWIDTDNFKA